MKKNLFILSILLILTLVFSLACSPKPQMQNLKERQFLIGTLVTLDIYHEDADLLEETMLEVTEKILSLEKIFSRRLDDAELYILNHSEQMTNSISDELYYLIEQSLRYGVLSEGFFDITTLPIIDLWGIDTDSPKIPTKEALANALKFVNINNLSLINNKQIVTSNNNVQIDLGGIAKGYITDEIVKILIENNIPYGIIDLGGNLYVHGKKDGVQPWVLGIRNPKGTVSDILGTLKLTDTSLVTSGAYERFFEVNGSIYHHILDPSTGYPVESDLLSASIIGKKSIDCDALSTSVFALGLDKGMALIESLDHTEAVLVTQDHKVFVSSGLIDNFQLTSEDYDLSN